MNPVVVHIVRPYSSEQEYLNAEAWSIGQRAMLLIDAETLPSDTAVLFDIALSDGQKPIRAEGRVVGVVGPSDGRPGGLKVRFKRFGAATKAFIERAVNAGRVNGEPERRSAPEAELPSAPGDDRFVEGDRPSLTEMRVSVTDLEPAPVASASDREPSGLRQRAPGPVAAPANRDELLQRLRQRRHSA